MAATISFIAAGYNLGASGIGFFGNGGFGNSVSVGAYQQTSYICDGAGVYNGGQINNVTYSHPLSGTVAGGTNLGLQYIPNYQSTLNIRLNNSTAVRTQNAQLYIYDRANINNPPTGVICAVAQAIHPSISQTVMGSGDPTWQFPAGSSYLAASYLYNGQGFSPGTSGYSINGASTTDVQHDWYFNLSASPTTVGAKTQFGLWFQSEYL